MSNVEQMMEEMKQAHAEKQETIQRVREMFPDIQFPDVEEHLILHYPRGAELEDAQVMRGRRLLVGNFGGDTYEEYGIISKEYHVVTHEEAIASLIDVLPEFPEYGEPEIKTKFIGNGAKMRVVIDFPEAPTITVAKNDPVRVRITGQNSYDLQWEYSVGVEGYVQVCSNGMMGWEALEKYNKKHNSTLMLDQSRFVLGNAMQAFSEQTEIWKLWSTQKLPVATFQHVIDGLPFGERHTEKLMELPIIQKKDTLKNLGTKGKATLWDVNLAATQFLTHEVESEKVKVDKGKEVAKFLSSIAKAA